MNSLRCLPVSSQALVLVCCLALLPVCESRAVEPDSDPDSPLVEKKKNSLVDSSHRFVTNRFDGIARWFDNFFGDEQSERESAHSIVRLAYRQTFFEGGEQADKLRLRGKVRLPELSRRVNLIFSDDEEEFRQQAGSNNRAFADEESQSIALQLDVRRESDFKLDHRIGLRSGGELRIGSRARYLKVFAERWKAGISEELYWQDTKGFGSRTITDIDYVHDPDRLTRWRTYYDYGEKTRGVEWHTRLSFSQALGDDRAISYYLRTFGVTRPEYLTRAYGPGLVYRQNFWKSWLFWEVEPQYSWVRGEIDDSREGVASITLRLEAVFSKKYLQ